MIIDRLYKCTEVIRDQDDISILNEDICNIKDVEYIALNFMKSSQHMYYKKQDYLKWCLI